MLARAVFLAGLALGLAQIRVLSPETLVEEFGKHGNILGTTATFGTPYYGERLVGQLVYAKSKGEYHCEDDDYDLSSFDRKTTHTDEEGNTRHLIFIVMVD